MQKDVRIEPEWKTQLAGEFEKPYFSALTAFIHDEYRKGMCYPPARLVFNAFDSTPFSQVKVVILGQDPYHGPNQAHGLCFSVNEGVEFPPSLKNIFQEIQDETGSPLPESGDLSRWARQGVFLLNTCLTVKEHHPFSHSGKGWETFTDATIQILNERCEHLVFMLWGAPARKKAALINQERHLVLESAHPSPLSAYRGFFGNGHFLQCNEYLQAHGLTPIQW